MVNFRKSVRFGPVRLTASKRGISTSVGVPGFRISHGADGKTRRTISLPGTGIYDTQVVGGGRGTRRSGQPTAAAIEWPEPAGPPVNGWQRRLVSGRLGLAGIRPKPDLTGLTIGQAVAILHQLGKDPRDLWRGGRAWGKVGRATREWLREV